ncbi:MAG: acyltransferase [Planctomycetaceae bacterium]|nr:acyltransferase [Planctomycetaceae bacterium]
MRRLLKTICNCLCGLVVAPAVVLFRLQSQMGQRDAFCGWMQFLSLLPGRMGVLLRHAFLRCTSGGCGKDAHVGFGTLFSHAGVSIGARSYIGNACSIGEVTIEDDVLIASHVSIMNGCQQHGTERLDVPIREQAGVYLPVTIGQNSWIGERAIVAASVGRHCIIGAGSLILKPVPDFCVAVGVPARVVRDRRVTVHGPMAESDDTLEEQIVSDVEITIGEMNSVGRLRNEGLPLKDCPAD